MLTGLVLTLHRAKACVAGGLGEQAFPPLHSAPGAESGPGCGDDSDTASLKKLAV